MLLLVLPRALLPLTLNLALTLTLTPTLTLLNAFERLVFPTA